MFIVGTMIQLLSNKITPYFQRLPMSKTPILLDGDSATIRNFGKIDTNRIRNGKCAAEAQYKRLGRSRSVSESS